MDKPTKMLSMLIVEDVESDAQLIVRLLKKAGYDLVYEQVEDAAEMRAALGRQPWDIIISDYSLPQFNGEAALAVLKETGQDIPFIVVSGTMGEETAVSMMKAGVQDYLMKDSLVRLLPAVERELKQAEIRRERRQAEEALFQSEDRYRRLAEYAPDIIFRYDTSPIMKLTYISPAVETITGYTPQECYDDPYLMINMIHPEDVNLMAGYLQSLAVPAEPFFARWIGKDGVIRWMESRIVPLHDADGRLIAVEGITRDITARKQAEEALASSESELRALVEQMPAIVYTESAGTRETTYISPQVEKVTGYTAAEWITDKDLWQRMIHPEDRVAVVEEDKRTTQFRVPFYSEYRILTRDGHIVWLHDEAVIIENQEGQPLFWRGVMYDITERKQAEESLRESQSLYHSLVEVSPLSICRKDLSGRFTFANRQFLEQSHITLDELLGKTDFDLHPPELAKKYRHDDEAILKSGQVQELIEERTVYGGEPTVVQSIKTPVYDGTGKINGIQISFWDITERKKFEKALQASERFARATVDALSAHIAILDENGTILAVNRAWRNFSERNSPAGSSVQVYEGMNYFSVCESADDEEGGGAATIEGIHAVIRGERTEFSLEYPCHSPNEKRWFNVRVTRFPGEGDLRIVVAHENITDLKLAEELLREQSEQLRVLYEASQRLNHTLELKEVYQAVADFVSAVIPSDVLVISSFSPETNLITCRAVVTKYGWQDVSAIPTIPLDEEGKGIQSIVIRTGQSLLLNDYQQRSKTSGVHYRIDDETLEILDETPLEGGASTRSAIIVPLKNGNLVSGVIQAMSYHQNAYTENQLKLLEALSLHIASAEKNALLYTQVQKELSERRQAEEFLRISEGRYRELFNSMIDGFALHEIICDDNGKPFDYRYLEVNPSFERLTGFRVADLIGRTVRELMPNTEPYWIEIFGNVALTGRSTFYENYSSELERYFEVSAYCPRLGQFAVITVDITERKRAEEAIHNRVIELEMLYQSGLALSRLLNPQEIGRTILKLLDENLNWRNTRIRLYHPEDNSLELLDFNQPGLDNEDERRQVIERFKSLITRPGQGLSGWAVQHGQSVRCGDIVNDPRYVAAYPGMRSGLYVPMKLGERTVGVISIEDEKLDAFAEADERLIVTLANQAASAFENARLFEETNKRVMELETLNRISLILRTASNKNEMLAIILDEALFILNTPHGSIELYNKSTDTLEQTIQRGWVAQLTSPHPMDEGIAGKVFTSGEIYISHEFAADPETREVARGQIPSGWGGVCLPIRAAQQTLGVMIISMPSDRELDKDEIRMLSILSEMTGAALLRMQLHEQTARRLEQLNALRAVEQSISSSHDMRLTLTILLTQIIAQLKVDAADVLLLHPGSSLLELVAGRGFRTLGLEGARLSDSFAGRAIMARRPFMEIGYETASQHPQFGKVWREEGFVRYWCVPLIVKGEIKGALEVYCRRVFAPDTEWIEFLEAFAGQAAIAIDNTQLFEDLQRANMELSLAYDATIEGWSRAMDLRDHETEGHTLRVTDLTLSLARAMQVGESQLTAIRRGALLHDIGKMGVPDAILLKEGTLTDEERAIMCHHPRFAREMLLPISYLHDAIDIPYCHHEKWDGTGYPQGLKGEQIPLAARLFAVVDVWDALTNDRTYRKKWSKQKAREYIQEQKGLHFDPQVVEIFLKYIERE